MKKRNEQDSAWKEILDAYLKDFMDYCLPEMSELIDWSQGWTSMENELRSIFKSHKQNKNVVDKLFEITLKNNEKRFLSLHVEVQGNKDESFPERLLRYDCLIYLKYKRPLISCIILTDNQTDWRPETFEAGIGGFGLSTKFAVVKILDYQDKLNELETSNNPFASVILTQFMATKSNRKPDKQRKQIKLNLTKRLYSKGLNKTDIDNLYKFIDWVIGLPEDIEVEYLQEISNLEEEETMPYVTFAERFGITKGVLATLLHGVKQRKEGLQEGLQEGELKSALKIAKAMLAKNADPFYVSEVTGLSLNDIQILKQQIETENA